MTRRRLAAVPDVPGTAGAAPDDEAVSANVEAFDLGRQVGRASRAGDFAAGLRTGISLITRVMAGDEALIEQIRALVEA